MRQTDTDENSLLKSPQKGIVPDLGPTPFRFTIYAEFIQNLCHI